MPGYAGPKWVDKATYAQMEVAGFDEAIATIPKPSEPLRVQVDQEGFDQDVASLPRPSETWRVQTEQQGFDEAIGNVPLPSQAFAQASVQGEQDAFDAAVADIPRPSETFQAAPPESPPPPEPPAPPEPPPALEPPPSPTPPSTPDAESDPVEATLRYLGTMRGDGAVGRRWDDGGAVGGGWEPPAAPGPLGTAGGFLAGQISQTGRQTEALREHGNLMAEKIARGEPITEEDRSRGGELVEPFATAMTGEPIAGVGGEVAGAAGRAVAGQVERLRLDKFPESVQGVIRQAAERGDFWLQQRRAVISDAEAERMADELNRSVDELVAGGRAGRAYNTEETRALRNALTGQALKVDDLKTTVEALGESASDALRRELGQEEASLLALSRVAEGARAEAGRAFRAYIADTRGRLARARGPEYTSVSRVPTTAAPELEGGVVQAGQFGAPPEHRLGQRDVPAQPRAPGSRTAALTEQTPLPMTLPGQPAPSLYDRLSLGRAAGMLSGTPTHLFNAAANTVQGGLTLGMKPLQVGVDLARVGAGRLVGADVERQRYLAEWGPQAAGYARGVWTGMQQVPRILARGADDATLASVNGRRLQSGSAVVDAAVEMPLRMLSASDAIFRNAAFGGHSAALATRQATREGLSGASRSQRAQEILGNLSDHPGLLEDASGLAARDVFQESRGVTEAMSRARAAHPGARVAADVFLPFFKTPYNVAAQGAGMSPAGFASALAAAGRAPLQSSARRKLASGVAHADLSAAEKGALRLPTPQAGEEVDRAVRATVGTAGLVIGLNLAANNLLTGPYPTDAAERSTLPEGWKPYSFRIPRGDGAVYVPITTVGALAVPLGAAANMHDAVQHGADEKDVTKTVLRGIGGMGKFMLEQSAFQGLNAITKLVTEPERSGEAFLENLAASAVPASAMMRQVQQALGVAARDPSNALEALMAAIPGLSGSVPERLTPMGEARSRGAEGPLAFVTGGRVGVEHDEAALRILRAAGVGIPTVARSYEGYTLTEDERRRIQERAGPLLRENLRGITQRDARADPRMVERLRDDALERARAVVLERKRAAPQREYRLPGAEAPTGAGGFRLPATVGAGR